ncbi:Inner membrane ABC transporter permease protein YcjP [archaeon HR01]|nr:Inner membrane ABC transporter permease protein YcjP [archaeon HR01]
MDNSRILGRFFETISLLILLFFIYIPFFWAVSTSFKGPQEWAARPPTIVPTNPTIANYLIQFQQLPREIYGSWYAAYGPATPFIVNSLIVTVLTIFLTFGAALSMTYLSKISRVISRMSPHFLFVDAIPKISMAVGFLALFTLLRGLYDSYYGLSIAYLAETLGLAIITLRIFYESLPPDIEESMMLMGYGRFRAFISNFFSNCRTALLLAIFLTFVFSWQDFTYALILTNFKSTVTVRLASFTHEVGELFGPRAALSILIGVPALILTLALFSRIREYYPNVQLYEMTGSKKYPQPRIKSEPLASIPFLLLYIMLLIAPFIMSGLYWFLLPSELPASQRLILQGVRYADALTSHQYMLSLLRTWIITVITIASTISAGLLTAYITVYEGGGWRRYLLFLTMIPLFIPPIVSGYIFRIIFYPSGPTEAFLELLGIPKVTWLSDPAGALAAVITANVWSSIPFAVLIMYGGARTVGREYWMSSMVMGAGRLRTFTSVIVPRLWRYILLTTLLVSIHTFEIFDIPYIMTFGGPGTATETVSFYIYNNAIKAGDAALSSALSVITGVIQILYTYLLIHMLRRF